MIILEEKKETSLASVVITVIAVILIVGLAGGFYYFMTTPAPIDQEPEMQTVVTPEPEPQIYIPPEPSTAVINFTFPSVLPAVIKQGSCASASLAQPDRADAFKCVVEGKTYDPCFGAKVGQVDKVVCQMNPLNATDIFQINLTLPLPKITPTVPVKENYAWFVELEDGTLLSPYTGKSPVVNGVKATYGSKAVNGQITVFVGDLIIGQLWTAQKKVIAKSGTVWIEKSSEIANIKTVWK